MSSAADSRRGRFRRVGGALFGWERPVELAEGEHTLREGMARRGYLDFSTAWLTLTTRRLVYGRVKLRGLLAYQNLLRGGWRLEIPLTDVTKVEFIPFWKNLRGYPQSGIEVTTAAGHRHRFSLYFARDWVADIDKQRRQKP